MTSHRPAQASRCVPSSVGGAVAVVALIVGAMSPARAGDVLVADRLSDKVFRYSADGTFLNVVLSEVSNDANDFISQPTGLALSPDGTQLYVSSSQTNNVIRYDYSRSAGTASNPSVFATAAEGLQFPSSITFSPDGDTIYVSNLGGTGVARFRHDGTSAGPALAPASSSAFPQLSGLAWTSAGELLVNGFTDSTGSRGGVLKSDAAVESMATFIGPSGSMMGASGILVHDNYVYVTGMFASNLQRFNLATGALDSSFSVTGLAFPQGLMLAPDGSGILVGILGYIAGQGHIAHYDFNGDLVGDGVFATAGGGGFQEATTFVTVPTLPGDFNGDYLVNEADLNLWKSNFGASDATTAMGDADRNGVVDGADFLIWQRQVAPPLPAIVANVPEPAAFSLMLVAATALRRRSSRIMEARR